MQDKLQKEIQKSEIIFCLSLVAFFSRKLSTHRGRQDVVWAAADEKGLADSAIAEFHCILRLT
jgi:hypothetical protein